jgi:hypothetical protein
VLLPLNRLSEWQSLHDGGYQPDSTGKKEKISLKAFKTFI